LGKDLKAYAAILLCTQDDFGHEKARKDLEGKVIDFEKALLRKGVYQASKLGNSSQISQDLPKCAFSPQNCSFSGMRMMRIEIQTPIQAAIQSLREEVLASANRPS
jgi:hypothetical protein